MVMTSARHDHLLNRSDDTSPDKRAAPAGIPDHVRFFNCTLHGATNFCNRLNLGSPKVILATYPFFCRAHARSGYSPTVGSRQSSRFHEVLRWTIRPHIFVPGKILWASLPS